MTDVKQNLLSASTDIQSVKCDCVWNINNASLCMENELRSPVYSVTTKGGLIQWKFLLKSCLSEAEKQAFKARNPYDIIIPLPQLPSPPSICEANNFQIEVEFLGAQPKKKCLISGSLTVNQLKYSFGLTTKGVGSISYLKGCFKDNPTCIVDITVCLKIPEGSLSHQMTIQQNSIQPTLQMHMGTLFDSAEFGDVSFVVGESTFPAHKAILAARSPVFEAMFRNDLKESKQGRVTITDIDGETFKVLLKFIYTDKIDNPSTTAFDSLLSAADKYGLETLKAHCEQQLCKNLTVKTVPKILILADLHRADKLKQRAIDFTRGHPEVLETADWKAIMNGFPQLENEVMRRVICHK